LAGDKIRISLDASAILKKWGIRIERARGGPALE